MLEVRHLSAGYGKTEILHDISFTAETGAVTTIIGCNGCGKSTLLRAICGVIPASAGGIRMDGDSVSALTRTGRARRAAFLAQGKNTPDITAGRMVLHGRFPHLSYPRKYKKADYEIAEAAMARLGIAHLADRPMAKLSGGTRQKVYIAMALAQCAPIIIMDEPTSWLDIGQQLRFAEIARGLADDRKTVLLVLHDLLLALKISDSICVMENGRLLIQDTPAAILQSGIISQIYGVEVCRLQTECGIQYYYRM